MQGDLEGIRRAWGQGRWPLSLPPALTASPPPSHANATHTNNSTVQRGGVPDLSHLPSNRAAAAAGGGDAEAPSDGSGLHRGDEGGRRG